MNAIAPMQPDPDRYIDQRLLPVWNASGILEETGNKDWIYARRPLVDDVPRIQEMLLFAHKAYGGTSLKFGPRPPVSHEILGVHMIHNFPNLEKFEIDSSSAGIIFAAHDVVETICDLVQKKENRLLSEAEVATIRREIYRIHADPQQFEKMRGSHIYITDTPNLEHHARTADQIARSFDSAGRCTIPYLYQLIRGVDKGIQLIKTDVWSRKNGYLPDEKLPRQIERAKEKSWVLQMPIIEANRAFVNAYNDGIVFLEDELNASSRKHYIAARRIPGRPVSASKPIASAGLSAPPIP